MNINKKDEPLDEWFWRVIECKPYVDDNGLHHPVTQTEQIKALPLMVLLLPVIVIKGIASSILH